VTRTAVPTPAPTEPPPIAPAPAQPALILVLAALLSLYFFWGSTYLAIRWAIEPPDGFPPFFMAGTRNLIAGIILYAIVRGRAGFAPASRPQPRHWRNAALVGTLLLLGGNGLVTFSEQYVPSSLVALIIAMLPIWMALLERVWEPAPPGAAAARSPAAWLGIALGFAGVVMLVGPQLLRALSADPDAGHADPAMGHATGLWSAIGTLAVLVSSFSWANGSLLSRRAKRSGGLPASPFLSTAMQLVCGGVALLLVSACAGEFSRVHASSFTALKPALSLAYLITAGSLIGFTSYIWLLGVTTPSRVATYAYVNPIVAVALGWSLAGEALTPLMLGAAAVIIAGVVLIVTFNRPAKSPSANLAESGEQDSCSASSPAGEGEACGARTTLSSR
jgi:drug/metabolite transporter (DMT)-like permease